MFIQSAPHKGREAWRDNMRADIERGGLEGPTDSLVKHFLLSSYLNDNTATSDEIPFVCPRLILISNNIFRNNPFKYLDFI